MIEVSLKEYLTVLAREPVGTRVQIHDDKRVELLPPPPEPIRTSGTRGRPRLGVEKLSDAERQRRYRARKRMTKGS